ncbi:MAG: hypothetical protein LRZ84_10545 [Desertifilum sp.]|nr:hypothetical protein [Desertifilum sp.]
MEKQIAFLWGWILIENPQMVKVKAIDTVFIFSGNRECKAPDMPWVISRTPVELNEELQMMEPSDIPSQLLKLIKQSAIEIMELDDSVELVEQEAG